MLPLRRHYLGNVGKSYRFYYQVKCHALVWGTNIVRRVGVL
ncbi:hypothetical protein [Yersinia alsatica]|nr:hypothetical protein [Yersinia alsatica]